MESVDPKKVFVGGISWNTDEESLRTYFHKFGPVATVEIKKDPPDRLDPGSKRHRGFGFVTFENSESVDRVLCQSFHQLDGKKIEPKPAEIRPVAPKPLQPGPMGGGSNDSSDGCDKKIFIGGVGSNTSEDHIKHYFKECYNMEVEVEFKYDKATHRMRGFGFVTLASSEEVDSVCKTRYHDINGKSVEFKRAQPRAATVSGQAIQQMKAQQQGAAAAYAGSYTYSQNYTQTNGQQFQQPFHYSGNQPYYYGTPAAQPAGYGQYSGTGTNYGFDASAYRTQSTSSERQDTQSYYQQTSSPYAGHGGSQQMGAYAQDTTSYPGRAAYPPTQDGYGQQTGYGQAPATHSQPTQYTTGTNYGHAHH